MINIIMYISLVIVIAVGGVLYFASLEQVSEDWVIHLPDGKIVEAVDCYTSHSVLRCNNNTTYFHNYTMAEKKND